VREFATAKSPEAASRADEAFAKANATMQVMKDTGDSGEMAYDQMIGAGNEKGNAIVQDVVDSLVAQARAVEGVVSALGLSIELEGSDSLDNPSAIQ
jgi:putative iron-regulated protein